MERIWTLEQVERLWLDVRSAWAIEAGLVSIAWGLDQTDSDVTEGGTAAWLAAWRAAALKAQALQVAEAAGAEWAEQIKKRQPK